MHLSILADSRPGVRKTAHKGHFLRVGNRRETDADVADRRAEHSHRPFLVRQAVKCLHRLLHVAFGIERYQLDPGAVDAALTIYFFGRQLRAAGNGIAPHRCGTAQILQVADNDLPCGSAHDRAVSREEGHTTHKHAHQNHYKVLFHLDPPVAVVHLARIFPYGSVKTADLTPVRPKCH